MENETKWTSDFIESFKSSIGSKEEDILRIKEEVVRARDAGGMVFFAGNGASTTIASHASLDYMNQLGMQCMCLNDPNVITCFSNDFGYEEVFARSIKIYGKPGDLCILVSSSGMSKNVVKAACIAKTLGLRIITLTGFDPDNDLKALGDVNLWIDSKVYNVVECAHMLMLVAVCDMIVSQEKEKIGEHGRII
jgi:D-sedoheptulose 7-phosphate isomerase